MKKFQAEPKEPQIDLGQAEEGKEKIEKKEFEVNTVADFFKKEEWEFENCDDESAKRKIGHQIIIIKMGLSKAGLSVHEVYVKKLPKGVLGIFDTQNRRISLGEDLLSDPNTKVGEFEMVGVHEGVAHKKDGIYDEGLAQIRTEKKIGRSTDIYQTEKQEARRTFRREGVDKALELYDLKNPDKLFEYYLQAELEKNFRGKIDELKRIKKNKRSLNSQASQQKKLIEGRFKKGARELFKKLESKGNYSVKKEIEDILLELAK